MNVPRTLFVGCDKGAWQMRGVQMAKALDARYHSKPTSDLWAWAEVIVLVKRAYEEWWKVAASTGKPVIWDVLDFWHQPRDNNALEYDLLAKINQIRRETNASVLLGATEVMAGAIGGIYLPHQSRIGLVPTPPKKTIRTVGYDGSLRYLGSWQSALERECARRGYTLSLNPYDLSHMDVLVAFRGEEWDGPICRRWKSGVKYVNAIAAGRPILTQRCAAWDEIQPFGLILEDQSALGDALDFLADRKVREKAYAMGLERAPSFTVEAIAERYAKILQKIARKPGVIA